MSVKKGEELYVARDWISLATGLAEQTITYHIGECTDLPLVMRKRGGQKKKYYLWSELLRQRPLLKELVERKQALEEVLLPTILCEKPSNVSMFQFVVLCTLLVFKINRGFWPTDSQIVRSLVVRKNFPRSSRSSVAFAIKALGRKGLIKIIDRKRQVGHGPQANQRIYIIVEGPQALTHRKMFCPECGDRILVPRDFMKVNSVTGRPNSLPFMPSRALGDSG